MEGNIQPEEWEKSLEKREQTREPRDLAEEIKMLVLEGGLESVSTRQWHYSKKGSENPHWHGENAGHDGTIAAPTIAPPSLREEEIMPGIPSLPIGGVLASSLLNTDTPSQKRTKCLSGHESPVI